MKTDIEIPVRSEKPRTAALVKWLTKKGVEKMQEERDQWVTVAANYSRALQSNPGYPISEYWATRGSPGRTSAD